MYHCQYRKLSYLIINHYYELTQHAKWVNKNHSSKSSFQHACMKTYQTTHRPTYLSNERRLFCSVCVLCDKQSTACVGLDEFSQQSQDARLGKQWLLLLVLILLALCVLPFHRLSDRCRRRHWWTTRCRVIDEWHRTNLMTSKGFKDCKKLFQPIFKHYLPDHVSLGINKNHKIISMPDLGIFN